MLGAGELMTGLRMIWTGVLWLIQSHQAPWSTINVTATIRPHILPWYAVRFFFVNEKPVGITILSARTIRPKWLPLRRSDNSPSPRMLTDPEGALLALDWGISERMARTVPAEHWLFVNLDGMHGERQIDFELRVRMLNNRRAEIPVWTRTNMLKLD